MKHGRGWEGAALESDAGCGVWRGCLHVDVESELHFFFLMDLRRLGFYSRQFAPNQDDMARIKPY